MTTLEVDEATMRIDTVRFDHKSQHMHVLLKDCREITVPLWWYPSLLKATPSERENYQILPFGDAIHWPDIDEDLDVRGFLIGSKAPGAEPPAA